MDRIKPIITDQDLEKIFKTGVELGSFNKAIHTLIKAGEINNYCVSVYEKKLNQLSAYKDLRLLKKTRRQNTGKLALMLRKKGIEYKRIGKILKVGSADAFYLVNKGKRNEYKTIGGVHKRIYTPAEQAKKSEKLVSDWNKYNIENRFPTDETIKAFEFLNLTPPERL